jgi:hypothetical protein
VRRAQLRPGVETQLGAQHRRGVTVDLQRLRLPSRPVERAHQVRPQPFLERVRRGERPQLLDDRPVVPERQFQGEPALGRVEAPFLHRGHLIAVQRRRIHVEQDRPSPQCGRGPQRPECGRPVAAIQGDAGALQQLVELLQVAAARRQVEDVPAVARVDGSVGTQQPAQPCHVRLQGRPRLSRGFVIPQPVDQDAHRHDAARAQQQ